MFTALRGGQRGRHHILCCCHTARQQHQNCVYSCKCSPYRRSAPLRPVRSGCSARTMEQEDRHLILLFSTLQGGNKSGWCFWCPVCFKCPPHRRLAPPPPERGGCSARTAQTAPPAAPSPRPGHTAASACTAGAMSVLINRS
jgi:hypothetical protein